MSRFIAHPKRGLGFAGLLIASILLVLSLPVFADDEFDGDGSATIKPIPELKYGENRDFLKDAEYYFDFIGTVDAVQDEGIVVGDSYFKKAARAKIKGAKKGARVGLILDEKGELVVCEPVKKRGK